jgi:hypothetical protein
MNIRSRGRAGAALGALAAVLLGGCGRGDDPTAQFSHVKGAKVKGVLLQNGKPIKFLPNEMITVSLTAAGDPSGAAAAGGGDVNAEDGTFAIPGPSNQGLPPGKYQVLVSADIYGGASGNPNRFEVLAKKKPPLTVDVGAEDGQTFEIDIGKWTATRK